MPDDNARVHLEFRMDGYPLCWTVKIPSCDAPAFDLTRDPIEVTCPDCRTIHAKPRLLHGRR